MSDLPFVVHLMNDPYSVRIDRKSIWGNPFHIGPHGTRKQVIAKYREWIMLPHQEHLRVRARKELRGKVLGCWCAPLPCHGDVLVEIANEPVKGEM